MQGGYTAAGEIANVINKQPRLNVAADSLEEIVMALDDILSAGNDHLERIAGPVPREVRAGPAVPPEPPPAYQVQRIERAIGRLRGITHVQAKELVDRLSTL